MSGSALGQLKSVRYVHRRWIAGDEQVTAEPRSRGARALRRCGHPANLGRKLVEDVLVDAAGDDGHDARVAVGTGGRRSAVSGDPGGDPSRSASGWPASWLTLMLSWI